MSVPQLRFSEFKDVWKNKDMSSLGKFKKGSLLSKADLTEDGNPCLLYGELYTTYGPVINNVTSRTDKIQVNFVYGNKNDVLIPSSGETSIDIACASALNISNVILGGDINVFTPIDGVNGPFISYQINGTKKIPLSKYGQGSSVVHLYNSSLMKFHLDMPSTEEQQKIASFFMLLDQKIDKQSEKIERLEELKKGMMQKIFSKELRFKDESGKGFPEWKEKRFGDVIENLIGGGTPSRQVEEYYFGDIPWVTVKDLKTNKYISDAEEYITEIGLNNSSSKIVDNGDLIIPTRMAVGRILIASGNVAINQDLKGCKLKSGYDTEFIYYLYSSKTTFIERLASGSTVSGISIDELMNIKIKVPIINEQRKIAEFLALVDVKLEKEREKSRLLIEQKNGLLQHMFI